ncbi:MAG: hypothetical protein KDC24_05025 [Saprospiraceae bacterium]|nr:hypothetical protein [Saprospiraceae bacterium]
MIQVSSNLTLFLKIFIPVFYLVFFGAFVGALWIQDYQYYGNIEGNTLRIGATLVYAAFLAIFYFTIFSLKRVEMDTNEMYVTNYVKHFKYSRESVATIAISPYPFIKIVTVTFNQPGYFGKKVRFVPSMARLTEVLAVCPEWKVKLKEKD